MRFPFSVFILFCIGLWAGGCATSAAKPVAATAPLPNAPTLQPQPSGPASPVFAFSTQNPGALPLVKARVNGVEGAFIIDTGAMVTVIDPAFADQAGLKDRLHQEGAAINGQGDGVDFAWVPKLQVGEAGFAQFHALLLDLSNLASGVGVKPAGILGANVLLCTSFAMDYRSGLAGWNQPALPDAAEVPAKFDNASVFVLAEIGGRPLPLLVDTGASCNLLLFQDWQGGRDEAGEMHAVRAGTASDEKVIIARLDSLVLGKTIFPAPQFRLNDSHRCLGTTFFAGRAFRLDPSRQTVEIAPRPAEAIPPGDAAGVRR